MSKQAPLTEQERANLVAYLDGEHESQDAAALEAKLSLNPNARAEAETLRRTWDLLDFLPRPEPSPNFTHDTMERISVLTPVARSPRWRWQPWALGFGWAAALLVVSTVGFAGGKLLHRGAVPASEPIVVNDETLVRELSVIENKRLYDNVESIDFLRALANPDDPDLFADENWDS